MRSERGRKLRGARRHYARLERQAQSLVSRVAAGGPFDLFHHHFDFRGYGNGRGRIRHRHLIVLFKAFERALQSAQAAAGELQIFASVAPAGRGGDDALYLHSRVGNEATYPYRYPGVQWGALAPAAIQPFLANRPWLVGQVRDERDTWWVVAAPKDPGIAI
jgi:hypothetical protein